VGVASLLRIILNFIKGDPMNRTFATHVSSNRAPVSRLNASIAALVCAGALLAAAGRVLAGPEAAVQLRFEKHRFAPQTLAVPATQPLVLNVTNASDETIEFESFALHREKVVEPGQTITLRFPALGAGSYDFYDDFHQDVAEGSIVAK
jgi:Cupredoxin-like domain